MIWRIFMFMLHPRKSKVDKAKKKTLVDAVRGALKQCRADAKRTFGQEVVDWVVMCVSFVYLTL